MRDGFVKVATRTPEVRVADVDFNVEHCVDVTREAVERDGAKLVVLPELCMPFTWSLQLLIRSPP